MFLRRSTEGLSLSKLLIQYMNMGELTSTICSFPSLTWCIPSWIWATNVAESPGVSWSRASWFPGGGDASIDATSLSRSAMPGSE
jgi:hypothetical protein